MNALADELVPPIVDVIDRCRAAAAAPIVGDRLERIVERLRAPMCVAVAGRVSTGKSTLVNALLRKRVAATGAAETTRRVAWFRHGEGERVHVVAKAGERIELRGVRLPLDDRLPWPRGLAASDVAHLEITLQSQRLVALSLVDTPGLQSATPGTSDRARRTLGVAADAASLDGTGTVATADAVVYVVNQDVHADAAEVLDDFIAATGGGPAGHARVIAVLNRADDFGGVSSPQCGALAASLQRRLGDRVDDVVPVVAKLAEAVYTGLIDEPVMAALVTLAGSPSERDDWLFDDVGYFPERSRLPPALSHRLLDRLDGFGLKTAVATIRACGPDPESVDAALTTASGVAGIDLRLDAIAERADLIKIRRALQELSASAFLVGPRAVEAVADLRTHPRYLVLDEQDLLDALAAGSLRLPHGIGDELLAILASGPPAQRLSRLGWRSPAQVSSRIDAWRALENTAETPFQAHAARIAQRRLQLLWRQLALKEDRHG